MSANRKTNTLTIQQPWFYTPFIRTISPKIHHYLCCKTNWLLNNREVTLVGDWPKGQWDLLGVLEREGRTRSCVLSFSTMYCKVGLMLFTMGEGCFVFSMHPEEYPPWKSGLEEGMDVPNGRTLAYINFASSLQTNCDSTSCSNTNWGRTNWDLCHILWVVTSHTWIRGSTRTCSVGKCYCRQPLAVVWVGNLLSMIWPTSPCKPIA